MTETDPAFEQALVRADRRAGNTTAAAMTQRAYDLRLIRAALESAMIGHPGIELAQAAFERLVIEYDLGNPE